ncbi:hypothetical protein [Mesorhizobium sp. M0139]|uniref:hypothetical protein n=1 Tax=Mesorhizobium sp. M0139 TaxID=2956892 RepID=UPI0033366E5D
MTASKLSRSPVGLQEARHHCGRKKADPRVLNTSIRDKTALHEHSRRAEWMRCRVAPGYHIEVVGHWCSTLNHRELVDLGTAELFSII